MVESDMACSQNMKEYFDYLDSNTQKAFVLAQKARKQGFDPQDFVEIKLAKNMAERVVGIISVVAPQIIDSGVTARILELEKEYGSQDWRVAMIIALEIAKENFCSFKSKIEAIEVGIRTGFAYVTVGVVSSPLEGLTSIEIIPRKDKQGEFFRLNYAGPIRNAGGTAAATSVLIADYVRKHLGYAKYDPDEKEMLRCAAELEDYHQYVANLQYFPFKEESKFLLENIPVEIAGDPSENRELSNAALKDLPRIKTNFLRSGYCLIHSSCIPLKAPKLWKQLDKWGSDMGMDDWNFLKEHIALQKELKAKTAEKKSDDISPDEKSLSKKDLIAAKVKPDPTFVKDLVGGRPVLGHPMRSGAFRLRYGRSRASGYSGQSAHPGTLAVLNDMIATGTQLKVERPGKAAAFTPCDTIMGPTVLLEDGSVKRIYSYDEGKAISFKVKEILYLGDALINYGDFFDRAHMLVPPAYVPEWWALELKKVADEKNLSLDKDVLAVLDKPLHNSPSFALAKKLSSLHAVPLHPDHVFFYREISPAQLLRLSEYLENATYDLSSKNPKLIFSSSIDFPLGKRSLELLGIPHRVEGEDDEERVILEGDIVLALCETLQVKSPTDAKTFTSFLQSCDHDSTLQIINKRSPFKIKDTSGVFIGARMGRPEKAKMRKMTGSPHSLFPIGEEGGRLRSFQSALEKGKVNADFPLFVCPKCEHETPFSVCDKCESRTKRLQFNRQTSLPIKDGETVPDNQVLEYKKQSVPIRDLFDYCLKKMKTRVYPDLIKGVRGTVGKDHTPEHLLKGILRARHDVHVNKDGTVRYDASELTLTHFKPSEVATSVARLRELGYEKDIHGNLLETDNQVLELKAQDIVLPACPVALDPGSDVVMLNTANFVDDLLQTMYGLPSYYNAKSASDLVGHLVVGLAPHTSAGTIARIIGFSQTQGFLAHPMYHAAMRRDCDGDESCFFLLMDAFLNFSQKYLGTSRGSTMDAPLVLTSLLNPAEVDDMAFNMDIVDHYPLDFYEACDAFRYPWDVKIKKINEVLFTPQQFEGMLFTHDTSDINVGVLCSSYKSLPSMGEKIDCQMDLAKKIRAVDTSDVARLIIEKHFIRDTKGILRKFSLQQFRCVACNAKFRRPPIMGSCTECGGKVIFTISEGSVIKYLEMSLALAEKYDVSNYLKQTLELLKVRVELYFGKEKELQSGLGSFMA